MNAGEDYDVVVIGAGPAGTSAALETTSAGLSTAIVDSFGFGGRLATLDELVDLPASTPSNGATLAAELGEKVMAAGAALSFDTAEAIAPGAGRFSVALGAGMLSATAVVIATGCAIGSVRLAGASELQGRGLSTCASCDGPLFRDQRVAVVGGGDSAALEALHLADQVQHVVMLFRETQLHCMPTLREAIATRENIECRGLATVVDLYTRDGALSGIEVAEDGAQRRLDVAAMFAYPGLEPRSDPAPAGALRSPERYLVVDERMRADASNLFAAGDVVEGTPKSVAAALTSGREAGGSVVCLLRPGVR